MLDGERLRSIFETEELLESKKSNDTVAIKSFAKQTEWLDDWTENICDLLCIVDKRSLKKGYSWEDVFKMLEKFVREKMKKDSEYRIALETSLSIFIYYWANFESQGGNKSNSYSEDSGWS